MKYKIGSTYKVVINDCCVKGEFTSKLVNTILDEIEPEEDDVRGLVFENGVTLTVIWGTEIKEIKDETELEF